MRLTHLENWQVFFFIINHFTNLLLRLCVQLPPLGPNDGEPLFGPFYIQSYGCVKPLNASHPLWKRRWEQQVQAQQGRNSRQQGSRRYTSWASGVFFLFVFFLLCSFYFYFLYSKMVPLNLHHHGTTSVYNALVSYFLLFLFFFTTNFFI